MRREFTENTEKHSEKDAAMKDSTDKRDWRMTTPQDASG